MRRPPRRTSGFQQTGGPHMGQQLIEAGSQLARICHIVYGLGRRNAPGRAGGTGGTGGTCLAGQTPGTPRSRRTGDAAYAMFTGTAMAAAAVRFKGIVSHWKSTFLYHNQPRNSSAGGARAQSILCARASGGARRQGNLYKTRVSSQVPVVIFRQMCYNVYTHI